MVTAMAAALIAANSPFAASYFLVHHTPVHFGLGKLAVNAPLVSWINEGLMVLFFLLMGLEIKRQFLEGHLSSLKCAALPAFAAFGGMAVPAAIYVALTWDSPDLIRGWAIPTATDIVLAIGVLSLLGERVPTSLKVFLTALAIFDDIGAVLIIGLFYGDGVSLLEIGFLALGIGGLIALNVFGISRFPPYVVAGLILWAAMLNAGLEAALAGVVIGLAIPMRASDGGRGPPLRQAERQLHPWVTLLVVPALAFFNSGISLAAVTPGALATPGSLGIVLGLFVGKPVGILASSWAAVRLGLAELPTGSGWARLYGVSMLAGIGFTMSLFIASLAFSAPAQASIAKLATLVGSMASAVVGLVVVAATTRSPRRLSLARKVSAPPSAAT